MAPDAESIKLLSEARAKAASLLEQLLSKQAELEANPPQVDTSKLAEGQFAMQKAIDAARRTVSSIDQALQIASISSN